MEPGNRTTAGRSGTTCQGGREAGIAAGVMWSGLDEVGTTATTLTPTCANPSTPLSSATAGSAAPSSAKQRELRMAERLPADHGEAG